MATVRATVRPVDTDHPARLFHNNFGFGDDLGRQRLQHAPASDGVFDIDDLATDDQPLLAATYALVSRSFQEFGQPEALQLTATGEIRRRYWHSWSKKILAWVGAVGVPLTEETLP